MSGARLSLLYQLLHSEDPVLSAQGAELLASLSGLLEGALLLGVDLTGRSLHGLDLRGILLARARLLQADLRDTDLRGADLRRADLRQADLRGARLSGARLEGAWIDASTRLEGVVWGTAPGLVLLNRRDCFRCGAQGAAPCLDLETGEPLPHPHPVRWHPHAYALMEPDGWSCDRCGGVWLWNIPARRPAPRFLCPGRPLYQQWEALPPGLRTRTQLHEAGLTPDDTPDAFFERRQGLLPLFLLQRLSP